MTFRTRSSSLYRLKLCPGSGWAELDAPDVEDDSEDAAEGTMLHEAMRGIAPKVPLTAEQEGALETAEGSREAALEMVRDAVPGWNPGIEAEEDRLVLRDGLEVILTGHFDEAQIDAERSAAYIEDRKFGRIAVDRADVNLQLQSYAVMGAFRWGLKRMQNGGWPLIPSTSVADSAFVRRGRPRLFPIRWSFTVGSRNSTRSCPTRLPWPSLTAFRRRRLKGFCGRPGT